MLKLVGFSHAIYKINLGYGSKGRDFSILVVLSIWHLKYLRKIVLIKRLICMLLGSVFGLWSLESYLLLVGVSGSLKGLLGRE